MRSFRGSIFGFVAALACASACGDDENGGSGDDGSSGSAGAAGAGMAGKAGSAGAAGTAGTGNGGTAGSSTGGNGGNAGAGMGGDDGGDGGMGGDDGGDGGMSGAGMGGAGAGGIAGAGMGGAGAGGIAGAGMGGAGAGTAGAGGGGGAGGALPAPINLFFTEYYEGTSTTQTSAVEIYNAGTESVNLIACTLRVYPNSVGTFNTILLTTTLPPNEVYVVCSTAIGASCDLVNNTMSQVTGNDAISLVCNGTEVQDIIGQTSLAPASGQWGTGLTSTADNTIRRMCNVTTGDKLGIDAFNPAFQWTGFTANTSGDLGIRFCP